MKKKNVLVAGSLIFFTLFLVGSWNLFNMRTMAVIFSEFVGGNSGNGGRGERVKSQ